MSYYKCPLCGYKFSTEEMKKSACTKCPLNKKCNIICCPNCNYQFVTESKTVSFLKNTFGKRLKKEKMMNKGPKRARYGQAGQTWKEIVDENIVDELLELIWTLRERGEVFLSELVKLTEVENPEQRLDQMRKEGLIELAKDKILLNKKGDQRAREITRRHRLAERLLSEIFLIEEKDMESSACEFEHILSPGVTESICTFLGHPPVCPHGKPIPPGECCAKFRTEIKPLVVPLTNLEIGKRAKIAFIAPRYHARLDRLSSLGVLPGNIIKLHQRKPSFVVEVDETTIALEHDIAQEIFVREI